METEVHAHCHFFLPLHTSYMSLDMLAAKFLDDVPLLLHDNGHMVIHVLVDVSEE
jgi:hypothetical protein